MDDQNVSNPVIPASPTPAPVQPMAQAQPGMQATQSISGATPAATPASPAAQTKMIGKYKVEVINDKCIGAASCVAIAANVFKLNEQNIAEVISQHGDPDDLKLLAAQSCPTAAIVVTDTQTGQKVWPLD